MPTVHRISRKFAKQIGVGDDPPKHAFEIGTKLRRGPEYFQFPPAPQGGEEHKWEAPARHTRYNGNDDDGDAACAGRRAKQFRSFGYGPGWSLSGKWYYEILYQGKKKCIGQFDSKEQADFVNSIAMKWLEKSSQSNLTAEEIESNLEKAEEAALGALEADDTLKIDFGLEEWLPRKRKSPAVYGDFARGKKWKTSKKVTRSSRGETGVVGIQQQAGKWRVQIHYQSKTRYMGTYDTKEEAILANQVARDMLEPSKGIDLSEAEIALNLNLAKEAVSNALADKGDELEHNRESVLTPSVADRRYSIDEDFAPPPKVYCSTDGISQQDSGQWSLDIMYKGQSRRMGVFDTLDQAVYFNGYARYHLETTGKAAMSDEDVELNLKRVKDAAWKALLKETKLCPPGKVGVSGNDSPHMEDRSSEENDPESDAESKETEIMSNVAGTSESNEGHPQKIVTPSDVSDSWDGSKDTVGRNNEAGCIPRNLANGAETASTPHEEKSTEVHLDFTTRNEKQSCETARVEDQGQGNSPVFESTEPTAEESVAEQNPKPPLTVHHQLASGFQYQTTSYCAVQAHAPWFYVDDQRLMQGPFNTSQMRLWYEAGYIRDNLHLSRSSSGPFLPLSSFFPNISQAFAPLQFSGASLKQSNDALKAHHQDGGETLSWDDNLTGAGSSPHGENREPCGSPLGGSVDVNDQSKESLTTKSSIGEREHIQTTAPQSCAAPNGTDGQIGHQHECIVTDSTSLDDRAVDAKSVVNCKDLESCDISLKSKADRDGKKACESGHLFDINQNVDKVNTCMYAAKNVTVEEKKVEDGLVPLATVPTGANIRIDDQRTHSLSPAPMSTQARGGGVIQSVEPELLRTTRPSYTCDGQQLKTSISLDGDAKPRSKLSSGEMQLYAGFQLWLKSKKKVWKEERAWRELTKGPMQARENKDGTRNKAMTFEQRIIHLKRYKDIHGHTNVNKKEDKSLHSFCRNVRSGRMGKKRRGVRMTEDRIAVLDALGFDWKGSNTLKKAKPKSCDLPHLEELLIALNEPGYAGPKLLPDRKQPNTEFHEWLDSKKKAWRKGREFSSKELDRSNDTSKAIALPTKPSPDLPAGWTSKTFQRMGGKNAGAHYTYFYSPTSIKFRSMLGCKRFLEILAEVGVDGDEKAALNVYKQRGHK